MLDDRFVNKLIFEQQLLKDINSLNKLIILSLNETNHHLNKILFNIIQIQNRLFNYLFEEKEEQCIQRQTLENLLNQILSNENLLIDKLKRIYLQINKKKKKTKKIFTSTIRLKQIKIPIHDINKQITEKNNQKSSQLQFNTYIEQTLKVYWRSMSSNNLFINIRKSESDTYLDHSSTNNHWNFTKLDKIKRIHQRIIINEN
jgi:hypothetical protein